MIVFPLMKRDPSPPPLYHPLISVLDHTKSTRDLDVGKVDVLLHGSQVVWVRENKELKHFL